MSRDPLGFWPVDDSATDPGTGSGEEGSREEGSREGACSESLGTWPGDLAAAFLDATARRQRLEASPPELPEQEVASKGRRVDLPAAQPPAGGQSLFEVIKSRRSGRIEQDPALTLQQLANVLGVVNQPCALVDDPWLLPKIYPAVVHVEGVAAGLYRYQATEHQLGEIGPLDRSDLPTRLLQHEHTRGAVLLFLATPMARWLTRHGERGYRGALLSVGWLTDQLYLAAEAEGLTYTASGGFPLATWDRALGLDGYHETLCLSFVLGARRRLADGSEPQNVD